MFRQLLNSSVKKKIEGRLVPKSVVSPPALKKFERFLSEILFPEFVEIHQHYPTIKVSTLGRKFHPISDDSGVVRK